MRTSASCVPKTQSAELRLAGSGRAGQKQRCRRALRPGESHPPAQHRPRRLLHGLRLTDDLFRQPFAQVQQPLLLGAAQLLDGDAGLLRDRRGDLLLADEWRRLIACGLAADQRLQAVAQLCGLLEAAVRHGLLQLPRDGALLLLHPAVAVAPTGQPDARGALVEQVERLVRQEPVGQIAARKLHRRVDRACGDAHAVVALQSRAESLQNFLRLGTARLPDGDGAEAPLERGVLLDKLAVFLQCRRADHLQLAAPQRGLEQVRRVDRALGAARADERVHLVDEQDHVPAAADLSQYVADAFFKFAAVFRPSEDARHVQAVEPFAAQRLRNRPRGEALRKALDDSRLADARLADEGGVVLIFPAQNLQQLPKLAFAPDDRLHCRRLFDHVLTI